MRPATSIGLLGLCALIALPNAAFSNEKTADNPNGCKVVERKGGAPAGANSGSLSSTVTAGGGHVSTSTSGGNGVTVYSGNGGGSSVATTSSSGGNGSTMVTTSNGNCIIYVDPGQRKADEK